MKKNLLFAAVFILACYFHSPASAQNVLGKIKEKVKDKTGKKEEEKSANDNSDDEKNGDNKTTPDTNGAATPTLRAYQNYDFVPGEKILFEDHFENEQDGEFPSHWELVNGQGQLNKNGKEEAFFLTEGNYAFAKPRMKTAKYLTDPFTLEWDYWAVDNSYPMRIAFQRIDKACDCEDDISLTVGNNEVAFEGSINLTKSYPDSVSSNFTNRWHHIAVAVKNHQMKVYVDQSRVLVVPDIKDDVYSLKFGGLPDEKTPVVFKNVRMASGGGMNVIGKKFTESKIVTHGINFDIDKASIRPESMGTLNMIAGVLRDNPDLKFSIEGHTDNSGTAAHNLTLSQQRAEAVRTQLVSMGIDASRLSTKGLGDTKPMSDNSTSEGKANNRRVEFVKM